MSSDRTNPPRRSTPPLDADRGRRQVPVRRSILSADDPAIAYSQQVEALGVDGARRWGIEYLAESGGIVPPGDVIMLARVPHYAEQLIDAEDENARGRLFGLIDLTISRVVGLLTNGPA